MRAFAFLAVVLLAVSVACAQSVFHPAEEVKAGTFGALVGGGNYTFNNSLFILDNLGIGTIAPAERLVVNGSLRVDNVTGSAVLFVNGTSGKVGIGTTTPGIKLDVSSAEVIDGMRVSAGTYAVYRTLVGGVGFEMYGTSDGLHFTKTGFADYMTIKDGGNVGIGTTNPSQKLVVVGDLNVTGSIIGSLVGAGDMLKSMYDPASKAAQILATSDLDADGTLTANSDAKIATQKAVKTFVNTNGYIASDILIISADTEHAYSGSTYGDYVLVKEIKIAYGGALRIKFDIRSGGEGNSVYGKVYRNGVAVGAERQTTSFTYVTMSADISGWSVGDLCQLYVRRWQAVIYYKNFRLYGTLNLPLVTLD